MRAAAALPLGRLFERREQEAFAQRHEIVDHGLFVDLGALAVAVGALVAPVGLLAFDRELADVALVGAVLADEVLDRVVDGREVPAAEGRDLAGATHALAGQQRHADGAHDAVVRRHDDLLAEDLGEGRGHGVVVGGAALEEDAVADLALAHEPVQVVVGDRVGEAGHEVFAGRAARLVAHHVALHEDRAAFAQADGRLRLQGQVGELADDVDAELLGLLFEERAGAGGAGLVHGEIDDDAVLHGDELGVLAADLEDGVDLPGDAAADEVGAGLVGGDLVGDEVGAAELADELASGPGGADAEHPDAVADLVAYLDESGVDDFDRTRLRLGVDRLDDLARPVEHDQVGRHRADVDAEKGVDDRAVGRELVGPGQVAQQQHALGRQRLGRREDGRRQARGIERDSARAGRPGIGAGRGVGFDQPGADGAHPGVEVGHEELVVGEPEGVAHGLHGALVGGDAADEGDGRLDELALGDGALVVADDGVAQPLEDLGRLVALLLGVDHVGLGEHAAAPGDVGRPAGGDDDVAHIFDLVEQATGLLVHERTRAGRAVAVGLVVGDAGAAGGRVGVEAQELRRLAAHLEDGDDVGVQSGEAASDGLELVLVGGLERLADEPAAGTGDAHATHRARRHHREELVEQGPGGFGRAALDAPVARREHGAPAGQREARRRKVEEVGSPGGATRKEVAFVSLADQRGLEADAADVYAQERHTGVCSDLPRDPYASPV